MTKEQKNTLLVALVTAFVTTYMGSALNLAIPNIEADFSVGAATVGWVVTCYMLTVSALNVIFGKIADSRGCRRKMIMAGIGIFAVASMTACFATQVWMLMVVRILQGAGAAMIFATNNAILISAFPEDQRGSVLGKSTAATYTGLSLGPVIGGLLNGIWGWRAVFLASFFVALSALVLAVRGLPKKEEKRIYAKPDSGGATLYVVMIVCILYGLTDLTVNTNARLILLAGVALLPIFAHVEKRMTDPIIKIEMFTKDRAFSFSNIAAFLNYGATYAIGYLLSIYLQLVMGFDSRVAGLILIIQPIVQAILSPAAGRLSDRIPPHRIASAGMGLCVVALLILMKLKVNTGLPLLVVVMIIAGSGFALFSSPNVNAIMSRVDKKDYSIVNAIVATMRNLGHTTSMAIVTITVGAMMGNIALESASSAELMHTMHVTFAIFVGLCVAGMFCSLARGKDE